MSQRERFEAWAAKQLNEDGLPYFLVKLPDGGYIDRDTKHAWQAWQAACPEEWQCVPKNNTTVEMRAPWKTMRGYSWFQKYQAMLSAAPKPEEAE